MEKYNYEAIIVGGGTTGIVAAYGLAKQGVKVAIIERLNSLCGTQTNALVTPFMPSYVYGSEFGDDLMKEYINFENNEAMIRFEDAISFNPETLKFVIEQVLTKSGVDIFYDTTLINTTVEEGQITEIQAHFLNRTLSFNALNFVDCTANAVLSQMAGLKVNSGDEVTGVNQAVSLRFEISNINFATLKQYLKKADYKFCDLEQEYLEFVHVPNAEVCGNILNVFSNGIKKGEINADDARYVQGFSMPGKLNTLSFNGPQLPNDRDFKEPLNYAFYNIKGREMQQRLHKFLKNNVPGFENSFISLSASMLGIRESYRVVGDYILNENDYANRQKFTDGVVKGDWYIDIHQDDLDVESATFKAKYDKNEFYEIPFRSFINSEIRNLIFAGRHISTTFKMQSSIRIQTTCYDMGSMVAKAIILANGKEVTSIDGIKLKEIIDNEK